MGAVASSGLDKTNFPIARPGSSTAMRIFSTNSFSRARPFNCNTPVPPGINAGDVTPALIPGGTGVLQLKGRALEKEFVENIRIAVDEPGLAIGKFVLSSPELATAPITAAAAVVAGDYWLK